MRFGLAVFGAVLIGGISVGLAVLAARLTAPSRRSCTFGGLWQPARPFRKAPVPVPSASADRPGRAWRADACSPGHEARSRATGTRCSRRWPSTHVVRVAVLQDRHQGSALVQRSAPKNQMPAPIANFEGVNNSQRRLTAGHRGRHRPELLHAVGQPPVPHLQSRRDSRDAGHAGLPALHRPERLRKPVRERRRPDRPLRPVRASLDRVPARISELSGPRAVLPVRRLLVDGRPDGHLVRLPVRRPADRSSTTTRSSASGRPSTPT